MPAKKKPSMRETQQRKMMMQKIAKGGPQKSGVKKPAPAKAAPSGRQPRAITNGGSATMKQIRAKAVQARRQGQGKPVMGGAKGRATVLPNSARAGKNLVKEGAQRLRTIGDSPTVRAAAQQGQRAVAAAKRNRARMAAGVGRGAKEASMLKGAAGVAGRAALPLAIGAQAKDVVGGFQKLANHPFIKNQGKGGKPTPSAGRRTNPKAAKPKAAKPAFNEKAYASQQKFAVPKPPAKPKPPAATAPSRSSAPARTPARSSAPARPAAAAFRPAASSAPKAPKVATTSGIGPVKSGTEYATKKGSISESVRQLRKMKKRSEERQKKK
jgi:hypothetical protein